MDTGIEIRLFDPRRKPPNWLDLMRPTQCAVFLKDRETSASLMPDGRPYLHTADIDCIVFDSLDATHQFCEARVLAVPHLRCEIYDSEGLAHPPLLVIVHPDYQSKEETSSSSSRRRQFAVGALFVSIPILCWIGFHRSDDLTPFLALNSFVIALRLLYWDFGLKHRERERRKRLEAHLRLERDDT